MSHNVERMLTNKQGAKAFGPTEIEREKSVLISCVAPSRIHHATLFDQPLEPACQHCQR